MYATPTWCQCKHWNVLRTTFSKIVPNAYCVWSVASVWPNNRLWEDTRMQWGPRWGVSSGRWISLPITMLPKICHGLRGNCQHNQWTTTGLFLDLDSELRATVLLSCYGGVTASNATVSNLITHHWKTDDASNRHSGLEALGWIVHPHWCSTHNG